MRREECAVLDNALIAPGHYILSLRSSVISKEARPGQFVQVTCNEAAFDPLLPRPFSFLSVSGNRIEILYHVVGKGTELLSRLKKGDTVPVLGPLGNGFDMSPEPGARSPERKILVGGGVGIPPLFHLAQILLKKISKKEEIHVFLGARNRSLLLCEKDFKKLGIQLHLSTDDGSKGSKGLVTGVLENYLRAPGSELPARVYTCGPTPMLKAVSALAAKYSLPCQAAVEVPMACGFGACLGCAIKVKSRGTGNGEQGTKSEGSAHRFAIACVEGPVFEGTEILWD